MTIYLDVVLLENLCMNYIILFATGYIMKIKMKQWRLVVSGLLGGVYAVVSYLNILPIYSRLEMKILLSVIIVYLAYHSKGIKQLGKQLVIFYLISFAFGGCAFALLYFIRPQDVLIQNGVYVGTYPIKIALLGGVVGFIITYIAFRVVKTKMKKKDMIEGIDLKGKYNQNDLKIISKQASTEKIEFSYFQIDGLRDKTIQDNINKEIERLTLNSYKEKINIDDVVNLSVSTSCTANYGNIISLNLYCWGRFDASKTDEQTEIIDIEKGVNFDLNTGNKIEFNEIFKTNAPMKDIIRKSTYYSILRDKAETNLSYEMIVNDYGNIEEDLAYVMEQYLRGKITEFYCTTSDIIILFDDMRIDIPMQDFADYIVIYNKFIKNEDLYEDDDIGIGNLYTLTTRQNDSYYYYTNYQNEANYFIDIFVEWQEENKTDFEKKLVENKIKDIEEEISNLKVLANQNTQNFYILNYKITIEDYVDETTKNTFIKYVEIGNSYDMTAHDFTENIEPIVIQKNREAHESDIEFVYDFSSLLGISPQETTEYYNPITGVKVVI